ncbi:helix-turn-helix transcriptional regulator [Pelagibius sp.]|uniref:helix-turn-helix transcriptional regulator n=1 Tax=Pelagibius sp. TaxID=1931238 RepID=UPI003BAEA4BC
MSLDPESFDGALDHVYRATTGELDWHDALRRVASTFDASCTAVAVERYNMAQVRCDPLNVAPIPETFHTSMSAWDGQQLYYTHYHRLDPFRAKVGLALTPSVLRMHDVCDVVEFAHSEYYQVLCRHIDCFHLGRFTSRINADVQLRVVINRGHKADPFDEQELALVHALGGHIARALRIQRQVTQMGATLAAALEALGRNGRAAFLVDRDARICQMNTKAEAICALGDGLTARHGRLVPQRPEAQRQLRAALSFQLGEGPKTAPKGPTFVVMHRSSAPMPYVAEVTPFAFDVLWRTPVAATALMTIDDPDSQRPVVSEIVASALSLTRTEARVAGLLASARSEREIATALSISLNTVKTHRKRIYAKLGITSRLELVSTIDAYR